MTLGVGLEDSGCRGRTFGGGSPKGSRPVKNGESPGGGLRLRTARLAGPRGGGPRRATRPAGWRDSRRAGGAFLARMENPSRRYRRRWSRRPRTRSDPSTRQPWQGHRRRAERCGASGFSARCSFGAIWIRPQRRPAQTVRLAGRSSGWTSRPTRVYVAARFQQWAREPLGVDLRFATIPNGTSVAMPHPDMPARSWTSPFAVVATRAVDLIARAQDH